MAPEESRLPCEVHYGSVTERYVLGRRLGHGQFGMVWEVTEKGTGRVRACKVIVTRGAPRGDPEFLRRCLRREIEAGVELGGKTAGVVRLLEVFRDEDRVYLVMELCAGGTLAEYVTRRRNRWWDEQHRLARAKASAREKERRARRRAEMLEMEAAWIIHQLASALATCHQHGVLHRDLKPENILLTAALDEEEWVSGVPGGARAKKRSAHAGSRHEKKETSGFLTLLHRSSKVRPTKAASPPHSPPQAPVTSQVKIADFGLAERLQAGESATVGYVGSPAFMAPEVLSKGDVSFPSDVWGLGVILYYLLTDGDLPFKGQSTGNIVQRILDASLDLDSPAAQALGSHAKAVLRQLLAASPQSRLTAAEVAQLPWVQEQLRRRAYAVAGYL